VSRSAGWESAFRADSGGLRLSPKSGARATRADGSVELYSRRDSAGTTRAGTPSAPAHRIEEVAVRLGRLDLVDEELGGLEVVHGVEELPEHPHLLQDRLLDQQLLAPRAGAVHVYRREDPLLVHASIEMDLHIAGALELLVDHVIHPRTGVDERSRENRQAAAFLDVACRAEEPLRPLQGVRVDPAGEHLARGRNHRVV